MNPVREQQMAEEVRRIYNYQVGQKAAVGKLLLVIGLAAGAVFFLATFASAVRQIFVGLIAH